MFLFPLPWRSDSREIVVHPAWGPDVQEDGAGRLRCAALTAMVEATDFRDRDDRTSGMFQRWVGDRACPSPAQGAFDSDDSTGGTM